MLINETKYVKIFVGIEYDPGSLFLKAPKK